jgi:hypothetical protein
VSEITHVAPRRACPLAESTSDAAGEEEIERLFDAEFVQIRVRPLATRETNSVVNNYDLRMGIQNRNDASKIC